MFKSPVVELLNSFRHLISSFNWEVIIHGCFQRISLMNTDGSLWKFKLYIFFWKRIELLRAQEVH